MKAILAALALAACQTAAQPDAVFVNARVYTVDAGFTVAEAFAVEDGRFSAVGDEAEVRVLAGEGTAVVDLGGMTVLPGLIDAHGHMAGLGQLSLGVIDLAGTTSYEQVIERVAERAALAEPGTWILGRGWDHESWPEKELPTHGALSEAVPDHPVWLARVDGHAALANERAMELAEVSPGTANPAGGELLRDDEGGLTGVFVDNAEGLVQRVIPDGAWGDARSLILAAQELCLAAGLTGVHDAGVGPDMVQVYRELEASGELRVRVFGMMPGHAAMRWYEEHEPYMGPFFSMRSCKLYMDGAMGSRGAWLLEPYEDRPFGDDGEPYVGLAVSEPVFVEAVTKHALENGYQVCTHAIGDRANREVLDAYLRGEMLAWNGLRPVDAPMPTKLTDARFRVEHAQLLAPEDIGRFVQLGVIPSMQPTHCTSDMRWVEARVGAARADGAYAWQSLLASGARIAGGSDFPVESHNPFLGLYAAVTRQNLDAEPSGGWRPSERMTREQALRSFTIDAAYAGFAEDKVGSIEPGKLADFIVIDRDIMACEPRAIANTLVLSTWVGGEKVFDREDRPN